MPPGLEPTSGSVRPKQPSFSPFAWRAANVFLLVAAEGVDGIHDERRLHADERAHAAVAALQFLHHQSVLDIRHLGAAIAFEVGAEEAELAHGLDQFLGEAAVAIALLDDGMRLSSTNLRVVSRTRRSSSVSRVSNSMKSTPLNFMAMRSRFSNRTDGRRGKAMNWCGPALFRELMRILGARKGGQTDFGRSTLAKHKCDPHAKYCAARYRIYAFRLLSWCRNQHIGTVARIARH